MIKNADTQPGILKRVFTGWTLLAFSWFGYVPGGVLLIVFGWKPKPGPYAIGELYPYGGYLEAWQVSLGFAFLAFGTLFGIASLICSKIPWCLDKIYRSDPGLDGNRRLGILTAQKACLAIIE